MTKQGRRRSARRVKPGSWTRGDVVARDDHGRGDRRAQLGGGQRSDPGGRDDHRQSRRPVADAAARRMAAAGNFQATDADGKLWDVQVGVQPSYVERAQRFVARLFRLGAARAASRSPTSMRLNAPGTLQPAAEPGRGDVFARRSARRCPTRPIGRCAEQVSSGEGRPARTAMRRHRARLGPVARESTARVDALRPLGWARLRRGSMRDRGWRGARHAAAALDAGPGSARCSSRPAARLR